MAVEQEFRDFSNEALRSWPRLSGRGLVKREVTNGWSCKGYALPKGELLDETASDFYQGETINVVWEEQDGDRYRWEQQRVENIVLVRVFKGVKNIGSYRDGELAQAYKCRLVPSTVSNGLTWQMENIMPGQEGEITYLYKGALLLPLASIGQGRRYGSQEE